MKRLTEQRIVFAVSALLGLGVIGCWIVLYVAGDYFSQQISAGAGPFARFQRMAGQLLGEMPPEQMAAALLAEFHKFAFRLTTIYAFCQATLLLASWQNPTLFRDFFSAKTHPLNLAVLRIAYFATLFPRVNLEGLKTYLQTPKSLWDAPPGLEWFIQLIPQSDTFIVGLYAVFAVACLAGLLGMCTRTACIVATVSAFVLMGIPQFFGKINHYHHIIWVGAILATSRCSDVLSIDALWSAFRGRQPVEKPEAANVYALPMRMILLFLGVIYFFPGFWKYVVSGPEWFMSDNLRSRVLLRMFVSEGWEPMLRIDQYPWLCRFAGLTTILMEIGFVFLVFNRLGRWVAAVGGLTFHFLVKQMLNISFWPIQVYYLAFADVHRVLTRLGRWLRPQGVQLSFDPDNPAACRMVSMLHTLDVFDVVSPVAAKASDQNPSGIAVQQKTGWRAIVSVAMSSPAVLLALPLALLESRVKRPVESRRIESRPSVPRNRVLGVMTVGTTILLVNILCGFTMTDTWPFGVYPTFARIIPPVFRSLTMDARDENGDVLADVEIFYDPAFREAFPVNRLGEIVQRVSTAPDRSERLVSIWNIWKQKHPEIAGAEQVNFYVANYSCVPEDAPSNPVDRTLMEIVSLDQIASTPLP